MAKLPAWSWLGVGLLLALVSWYAELDLFFWLGWVFIIIGAAKLVLGAVRGQKRHPAEHRAAAGHAAHSHATHQHAAHPAHQHYYRCACGNVVRKTDNFCSWCGRRLK